MYNMLSPTQLSTLRALDEKPQPVRKNTAGALMRYGYIEPDGTLYKLTIRGRSFIRDYVERTGDGPEDLKAMFRF